MCCLKMTAADSEQILNLPVNRKGPLSLGD